MQHPLPLKPDDTPVAGVISLSNNDQSITFSPQTSLERGGSYLFEIASSVTDLAGNALVAPFTLNFSADGIAPSIYAISPAPDSSDAAVGASVAITFNEALDASSVTNDQILLSSDFGAVAGTVDLSPDQTTLVFKPTAKLSYNRAYNVTLKAGVADSSGNASGEEYSFTFTTKLPNSNLVGYWAMDGDWSDSSGNGNHASAGGATLVTESLNGSHAGSFDGIDDYAEIRNPSALSIGDDSWTISAWVKTSYSGPEKKVVVSRYECGWNSCDALDGSSKTYYELFVDGSGHPSFRIRGDHQTTGNELIAAVDIRDGEWHQLVSVLDRTEAAMILYVDGEEASRFSVPVYYSINDSGSPVSIGRQFIESHLSWGPSIKYFNGLIDEVAIYRAALDAGEVKEGYNATLLDDNEPPAAPTVNDAPSSTYGSAVALSGGKEVDSSIRINGEQVAAHDAVTTWQAVYSLQPGQNILEITSRDLSGNRSDIVAVVVDRLPLNQLETDLVGYWPMDGDWLDYSGNGNHGAAWGAMFTNETPFGGMSAYFDGEDDYMRVYPFTMPATELTTSFWMRSSDTSKKGSAISYASSKSSNAFLLYNYKDFRPHVGSHAVGTGVSANDGIWHHIVVTWEGASGQTKLYKDSALAFSGTLAQGETIAPNGHLIFAQEQDSFGGSYDPTQAFKGLLDDVSIYRRVLSAEEVQQKYDPRPSIQLTSPGQTVHYWPGQSGGASFTLTHWQDIDHMVCSASGAASSGFAEWSNGFAAGAVNDYFSFVVDSAADPNDIITLTCAATDADGDVGVATLELEVAD
ncbi:MAG: Ig-like domain-containing protein [Desulfuromonadales bacterium]|nr:Ig-like domain-containing protein [Desulfuromonadales bacterium]